MLKRRKTFVVEKSKYPEDKKTHLVIMKSFTEHGLNEQRIFKGTYQECVNEKKRIEDVIRKYI